MSAELQIYHVSMREPDQAAPSTGGDPHKRKQQRSFQKELRNESPRAQQHDHRPEELKAQRTSELRFTEEASKTAEPERKNRSQQWYQQHSSQNNPAPVSRTNPAAPEHARPPASAESLSEIRNKRSFHSAAGATGARFRTERGKKPGSQKLQAATAPVRLSFDSAKKGSQKLDEDNSDRAVLRTSEGLAGTGGRIVRTTLQKQRSRFGASRSVKRSEETGTLFFSNPISRMLQKKKLKRKYLAKLTGQAPSNAAETAEKAGELVARGVDLGKRIVLGVVKKAGGIGLLLAGIAAITSFLASALVSCGVLFAGAGGASEFAAYSAETFEIWAAEGTYCEMEQELRERLEDYENTHDYDEYHYELDDIGHDPYVLTSLVCSIHSGEWTLEEVRPTLEQVFSLQYTLTEEVEEEAAESTEPSPTEPSPTEPPSPRPPRPEPLPQSQKKEPANGTGSSTRTVCTVRLENFDLSHLPVYFLNEPQLERYAAYMATLGCRPDLFPDSEYIGRYGEGSYLDYEIPSELLEDEVFAAMMQEARRYLGYPYVWGGASPGTSFDCSGFVCWVINHSGWNVGRLSAQGLYNICTQTSAPQPGDLVFFERTYDTTEVSHVGIYVGNHMMIHCGDPISFADLNTSYWQEHLYGYGRLP